MAWPSLDTAGHVPAFASDSPHSGIPAMIAESPSGALNEIVSRRCWPSPRVRCITNGVNAPASVVDEPAVRAGVNGSTPDAQGVPLGPSTVANAAVCSESAASGELQGVKSASLTFLLLH